MIYGWCEIHDGPIKVGGREFLVSDGEEILSTCHVCCTGLGLGFLVDRDVTNFTWAGPSPE